MGPLAWTALVAAIALAALAVTLWSRLATARSATERLEREVRSLRAEARETAAAEPWLLRAFEGIPLGTIALGSDGEIVFANPPASRFVNARHGDAVAEVVIRRLGHQAASAGTVVEEDVEVYAAGHVHYTIQAVPVRDVEGVAAIVFVENVTQQRRVDDVRRDFVANVSHELKTPLGALSLLAETVAGEQDEETRHKLTERMAAEAQRMSRLVDDVLTLSRVESEDAELDVVDLRTVIGASVDRSSALAVECGVTLDVDVPGAPVMVNGDRAQLESMVGNLLENAIKYTASAERRGGGAVRVTVAADEEATAVVADEGVGIAPEHLDRIFERFYRVDRGRSRHSGGTGLGLAIVRHVAINHGGDVAVESTPGVGTTFTVRLPLSNAHDVETGSDRGE